MARCANGVRMTAHILFYLMGLVIAFRFGWVMALHYGKPKYTDEFLKLVKSIEGFEDECND